MSTAELESSLVSTLNGRLKGVGKATLIAPKEIRVDFEKLKSEPLECVKFRLEAIGDMEFFLAACNRIPLNKSSTVEKYDDNSPKQLDTGSGPHVAEWIKHPKGVFQNVITEKDRLISRVVNGESEYLLSPISSRVLGNHLRAVRIKHNKDAHCTVAFQFDQEGSSELENIVQQRKDSGVTKENINYLVVFLIDHQIIGCGVARLNPQLEVFIGVNRFSDAEANAIVAICNAGKLPCSIREAK